MSDENEVTQQDGEVYNDHSVDNSVHHAVNLWPLFLVAAVIVSGLLAYNFLPDAKQRAKLIVQGKSFTASGAIVDCVSVGMGSYEEAAYRSYIRTPKDEVFAVYWRHDHQPPPFGLAIGVIKYHECGSQGGNVVHCFDSFAFSGEGVKPLDVNGKPIVPKS